MVTRRPASAEDGGMISSVRANNDSPVVFFPAPPDEVPNSEGNILAPAPCKEDVPALDKGEGAIPKVRSSLRHNRDKAERLMIKQATHCPVVVTLGKERGFPHLEP